MDQSDIQRVLSDLDEAALAKVMKLQSVRDAMKDLETVEAHLASCSDNLKEREDWETTKTELLAEIKRLTRRPTATR